MNVREMGLPEHWQSGVLEPVFEERTAWALEVEGTIPDALDGVLVRNGTNPPPVKIDGRFHPWTGDGMLHGVRLRGGRAVWYRNRWVRTEVLADKLDGLEAAGGPADVPLERVWAPNSSNTSVVVHAGKILSLNETGLPYEINRCLETVARWNFGGRLDTTMCAHPKVDPVTGEMAFISFGPHDPQLRCHLVDADGALRRQVDVAVPGSSLMHDMGLTEHYVLFFDQPVVYDQAFLDRGEFPFHWDEDYGNRIGVMPRDGEGGDVRWFDVEPGYFIHVFNAYELDAEIVVDVARYDRLLEPGNADPRRQRHRSALHRYRLDLATGTAREEQLDDVPFDFPVIAGGHVAQPNRYGYGVRAHREGDVVRFDAPIKYDLRDGSPTLHDVGPRRSASEGVFVADPSASGEDEGWLLSFVYDWDRDRSDLVIIDARDFSGPPQAVIRLPQRVPQGFHGTWIPSERDGA